MEKSEADKAKSSSLSGNTIDIENKGSGDLQMSDQYLKEGIIILSNMIRAIG